MDQRDKIVHILQNTERIRQVAVKLAKELANAQAGLEMTQNDNKMT